ncbi:MAG: hypothetical protein AAFX06_21215 [Planctomycetota bacterium]
MPENEQPVDELSVAASKAAVTNDAVRLVRDRHEYESLTLTVVVLGHAG